MGMDVEQLSGTLETIPHDARTYEIESPVQVGDMTNLVWQGLPGELCWLVISGGANPVYQPLFQGTAVPEPAIIIFLGTVPASGVLSVPVNINLNPAKECAVVFEQGLYFTLPTGFVLGEPRVGVILQ